MRAYSGEKLAHDRMDIISSSLLLASLPAVYPGLRAYRNLLLKVMSKTRINNFGIEGNDRF